MRSPKTTDTEFSKMTTSFWDDVFMRCRGSLPTAEERPVMNALTERAALLIYREREHSAVVTADRLFDAIRRASLELVAEHGKSEVTA